MAYLDTQGAFLPFLESMAYLNTEGVKQKSELS